MPRNAISPLITAALVLTCSCTDHSTQDDHRQALLETLESRQHAVVQGDVEQIFSYWSDDVVIYPVSQPAVKGIAAVRHYVRQTRQELGLRPRISPLEVVASESGDLGYIVGTYEMIDREGQATLPGRYVSLWRTNKRGEWKCFLEIHSPRPAQSTDETIAK